VQCEPAIAWTRESGCMSTKPLDQLVGIFEGLVALRDIRNAHPDEAVTRFVSFCAANVTASAAQIFQDLMVLFFTGCKRGGYFVEFGATNGVELSNTYVLERQFGWNGLLAEPARRWHDALATNRRCAIDQRCIWRASGERIQFNETAAGEFSTIEEFSERDLYREHRSSGDRYLVETVSLNDLLAFHNCPFKIDYLSIDTEGSELTILSNFDFTKYDVSIITVEHNYCEPDRTRLHELLTANDFTRVLTFFSRWDDWYLKRALIGA
jgi:FkbM family methyltransferase